MSDTPRTDAYAEQCRLMSSHKAMYIEALDLARTLEREIAEEQRTGFAMSAELERLRALLEEACDILFIARGAALKLRATGCTHAEGCELIREYDTIMAWTKDARAALAKDPEQRHGGAVAESHAPATSEPGDAGVAPGQPSVVPDPISGEAAVQICRLLKEASSASWLDEATKLVDQALALIPFDPDDPNYEPRQGGVCPRCNGPLFDGVDHDCPNGSAAPGDRDEPIEGLGVGTSERKA